MKKFSRVLVVSCVILSLLFTLAFADNNKQLGEQKLKNQDESIKIYKQLKDSLKKNDNKTTDLEYYAGEYIDDNGDLVIMLKGKKDKDIKELKTMAKSEKIKFKDAEYSLKHLKDIRNMLRENYDFLEKKV